MRAIIQDIKERERRGTTITTTTVTAAAAATNNKNTDELSCYFTQQTADCYHPTRISCMDDYKLQINTYD